MPSHPPPVYMCYLLWIDVAFEVGAAFGGWFLLLGLVCVVGDACCSSVCGWLCVCTAQHPF
jgi:hypothetical protein